MKCQTSSLERNIKYFKISSAEIFTQHSKRSVTGRTYCHTRVLLLLYCVYPKCSDSYLVIKMLTVLVSTISNSQVFLLKKCE